LPETKVAANLRLAESLCTARGVRLTTQRRTVLELLCDSPTPLNAYEILDRMRGSLRNPAPTTVYRALEFLLEQGLIHKLETLHAFIGCSRPNHTHSSQFLICSNCGEVDEMENDAISRCLKSATRSAGFKPTRPVVEILGTCAQCSRRPLSEC